MGRARAQDRFRAIEWDVVIVDEAHVLKNDKAKLHVPVSQAHLLSRYVGMSKSQVRLHRLGGRRWKNEKSRAKESVVDLAASLLETQAQRDLLKGFSFPENMARSSR